MFKCIRQFLFLSNATKNNIFMDKVKLNCTALYIHVPFCSSICVYCDFCAMKVPERIHNEYIDLILEEIKLRAKSCISGLETIYLGGGSPSVLSINNLQKLLNGLQKIGLQTNRLKEFTMEWNPEQVSKEKIELALSYGINRFSLGIQSFNNDLLKILKRNHSAKDALIAFEKLNEKFSTGNADLMFCLPGQNTEMFLADIKTLVKLKAKHISFYGLTLKKHNKLPPQPEDLYPEMYLKATELLEESGLHRYEVSNFAKPGNESKHNMVYWKMEPYLGAGPAAHSYLNDVRSCAGEKYSVWKKWVLNGCLQEGLNIDVVSSEGKEIEFVWLSLRTKEGLSLERYKAMFNKEFDIKKAEPFIEKGSLILKDNFLKLNAEGWLWLDKILYCINN